MVVIFTPDNEPYLGRQTLFRFDKVLSIFIAEQRRISSQTPTVPLTPLQRAASEIVPSASSIALSIREMVRQGYLLSALILTRPLMERVASLSYLIENPRAVPQWEQGWPHKTRPTLKQRIRALGTDVGIEDFPMPRNLDQYNGLVHGDRDAALRGAVQLPDGGAGYTIGKDLESPARADDICAETTIWLIVLTVRCGQIFPPTN